MGSSLFKKIRDVEKAEFIESWAESQDPNDGCAKSVLDLHRVSDFVYAEIELAAEALNRTILPNHNHGPTGVPNNGEPLGHYGYRVLHFVYDQNLNNDCTGRLRSLLSYFDNKGNHGNFLKGRHMFLTDDRELAFKGQYEDFEDVLFTGSFHQFAAYASWVAKNGFKPLRLYLATKRI